MSDGWAKALISTSITSRPKAVVLDAEKKNLIFSRIVTT
jgi:hypothetical protein